MQNEIRMKYDFLLFENYHQATHHLYDVLLIARMMRSQGLHVAIFDIFHEIKEDDMEGVPVIHWVSRNQIPNDTWMVSRHSKLDTLVKSGRLRRQTKKYFKEVVSFISDKADAFYCGSYHNGISTELFNLQKPCYYWGLRSDRFSFTWRKLLPSPLGGLQILKQRRTFLRNPYQRLFVSNPIIMEEHEKLGVPRNRMVIREERLVEQNTDANLTSLDKQMSFLVIGQLRKEKHVPTTIRAFQKSEIVNSRLKLIGRSREDYEQEIIKVINNDTRIERVNAYLEYEDFFKFFSQSHFVLFADEQGRSCITNGTMMEALIHHRPVICPNYNPYTYYIEKYGIGLQYRAGDVESYAETLRRASVLGVEHFQKAIDLFLENIMFDRVAQQFVNDIKAQM